MKKQHIIISAIFLLFFLTNAVFVVDQREQALVFQFGEIVRVEKEAGLKFKIPLIQNIVMFDKRALDIATQPLQLIALDQKRPVVSAFAKFKITDPAAFYQSYTDERSAKAKLASYVESALRENVAKVPLASLLTTERINVMKKTKEHANNAANKFGAQIIDVRILRADLPKENSQGIFQRMRSDREKEAHEIRAEGAEQAQNIKAKADKLSKIIIAEAMKKAQILRGEGDGEASKIYAKTYSQDAEFFEFYRSLEAYNNTINKDNTKIIMPLDKGFYSKLQ